MRQTPHGVPIFGLRYSIPGLPRSSGAICTMRTTEDSPVVLDAVTDHTTRTMVAHWGESLDCTLKTVERVMPSGLNHFKRLIVFISAHFTDCHVQLSRL